MDTHRIRQILDLIPDAEVVVQTDGSLIVRTPLRPPGVFVVNPDGSLRRRGTPPPMPKVEPFDNERTPVVRTGHVKG